MILPHIDISRESDNWPLESRLEELVKVAIEAAAKTADLKWPDDAELSLVFTDDAAMTKLNRQWRNKPQPTNVLSFPGGDIHVGESSDVMIGDLVFAFETVVREGEEQGKAFESHLTHLVIHGFFHLFGYDHINDKDAERMEALEKAALLSLGIDDPYKETF
jgi:probable rRNA maturation factor